MKIIIKEKKKSRRRGTKAKIWKDFKGRNFLCPLNLEYATLRACGCVHQARALRILNQRRSQDGGGVGRGEHFLPLTNSSKEHLNVE